MSEKRCYTVQELQEILGVSRPTIYNLLKKKEFRWIQLDDGKYRISKKSFDDWLDNLEHEAVIVDYWKRIPKDSFRNWYKSQSRYRTKEDREKDALLEDATITMEQRDLERSMQ